MRVADLLRTLADKIDGIEQGPAQPQAVAPQEVPHQEQKPALVAVKVDNADGSEAGVFVPPLQTKLEILKKSVGLDNVYDGESNELADIKKLSGLSAPQQEAADDEPLE